MGRRYEISGQQWEIICNKLPCQPGYRGKQSNNRLFINAVMFVAKCGIPWRDLPERFGNWNSVYVRFRRWAKKGVWQRIFKDLTDKDVKTLLIDSTSIRVHQHGAGALKKEDQSKRNDQATGRSRGGLTTKIHLSTNGAGRINNILLSGGRTADIKMALDLMQPVKAEKVIADKAYDSNWLLYYLDSENIEAVIPPKKSRLQQRTIDHRTAYKQRNVIERTINKLKQYRKIATPTKKQLLPFCLSAAWLLPSLTLTCRCHHIRIMDLSFIFYRFYT